ncbi:MAG: oligoendopeptidase F, partial [Ruminiclostridium sp.]|nr:oligoendopeptidase F [Ruminiclostridium sp.]
MEEKKLPKRSEVPDEFKWHINDIYESDEAFEKELKDAGRYPGILESYAGKLSSSSAALLEYMKLDDELTVIAENLINYANRKSDEDTAVSLYSGYCDRVNALFVAIGSASAFAV